MARCLTKINFALKTLLFFTFAPIKSIKIMSILFLGNLGATEIILIIVAILILFGGKKIPELMRGVGQGMREFQNAKNNVKSEIEKGMQEKPQEKSTDEK